MKKTSIALLIMGVQLLSAKSLSFQHHDWQVVCDNTNACRIAGYSSDNSDGNRVSVLITREAGVRTKMKAEVELGRYGEEDEKLFKRFPFSFKLEMFINGKSYGFVGMKKSELISSLSTRQTEALVNSLSKNSEIVWKYKKYKWQLSDSGSTAVLLKADEFQKRLNTRTAFYKKGSRSEKNVLKAKKIPTIYAQKVDGNKEMIVKDKAYIEKVRSALSSKDEQCFESDYQGDGSLKFYSLNASKMVVSKAVWMAAYNEGHCTWVVNKKEPFNPQPAVEGSYYVEGNIGMVSNSQKWRGLGDCWSYEEHVWTGESLEQSSVGSTGLCRLIAGGGAWSLPTFVSKVKVR